MTKVLITGAGGAVGSALLEELATSTSEIVATDISKPAWLPPVARYEKLDVRGDDADEVIGAERPEVVIHLASIVGHATREFAYSVDVTGSGNILDACVKYGVRRVVVTSSGAAYGYHADNPVPLRETDRLRGNPEFPYSDHKRQVEEHLAELRASNPELEQVIFRVGTVLGPGLENQITALFHKKALLAVKGSESPFVFISTTDLSKILARSVGAGPAGIYNVAGDGSLGVSEIAAILNKPVRRLPVWLLKCALAIGKPLRITRYGPEQVRFLQYRPVLDNRMLKEEFGYTPEMTSREAFEAWRKAAGL